MEPRNPQELHTKQASYASHNTTAHSCEEDPAVDKGAHYCHK